MSKTKFLTLFVLALVAAGCVSPRKKAAADARDAARAKTQTEEAAYVPGVDVTEASIRGQEFGQTPELGVIRFDYDSATLQGEALDTLKKNAEWLKSHPDLEVLVSGHCDERGTIEYNLALGQKRAKSVREYYARLGVPGKSVATISYGKESPVCSESTEDCWAQNRRAETKIRTRTASNGHRRRDAQ